MHSNLEGITQFLSCILNSANHNLGLDDTVISLFDAYYINEMRFDISLLSRHTLYLDKSMKKG